MKTERTCILSEMLEDFDPKAIKDESLREAFLYLMNMVETLSAKVAELSEENQRLRDENNRRKRRTRQATDLAK